MEAKFVAGAVGDKSFTRAELLFEIKDAVEKKCSDLIHSIQEKMCNGYPLFVPIEVDVKIEKRWGKMEKLN